uniref:HEAT repeat-containing protein 5A n=1 Tax=Eptatretus burgeri TaxID=7764 RepID=A0A8C4QZX9_EPTBU
MELAHSLLLNEEALTQVTDSKKPVFVFKWLRFLDKILADVREKQKRLVEQLTNLLLDAPGPPTRRLLARNMAAIYTVGDTFTVFQTLDRCNDIIRSKDDSPSFLPTKLAAVACVGALYENLGRMLGSTFADTVNNLLKAVKNAESQGRSEIMLSLEKVLAGLGGAAASCHRDIYKIARSCLSDRSMAVRCAAAKCLLELQKEAVFLWTTELENVATVCFKALEGSTYDVRVAVSQLLGTVLATAVGPKQAAVMRPNMRRVSVDEALELLALGFLRGGSGFLRSGGDMLKGGTTINRDVRVGVTQAYVVFVSTLGGTWLERHFPQFLSHVLELVAQPRAAPTHVEAVYSRRCVSFVLHATAGALLGEKAQVAAALEICHAIGKQMKAVDAAVSDSNTEARVGTTDVSASQHVLVCALRELGCLLHSLSTSAAPLVQDPHNGVLETLLSILVHPSASARLAATWCLRSLAVALPAQLVPLLSSCSERLDTLRASPDAVTGFSCAIAALLGGVQQCPLGIPHTWGKKVMSIAEDLLRTASQSSRLSQQRTQAGWLLLGALMTLGPMVVRYHLPKMLLLWRNVFPRSPKELESERSRGDAFTWQVTLEGRAGALCAMRSFVAHCRELLTEDVMRRLMIPIECALLMMTMPAVIKMHGNHLKASVAMVRLRLYDILALLPPSTYEGSFNSLLRELVAEFTLTDNPSNTTTSLLRSFCHYDDSVLLGSLMSCSGALEHDPSSIYLRAPEGEAVPGPLPLGVAVIDASVALFGVVFPHVSFKHRLQMLEHFAECIKQAKGSRQQAVQLNIFTAVLSALKGLAENKSPMGPEEVRRAALALVLVALDHSSPLVRCAAGEALGRMAQAVDESAFITRMAQTSFDKLKVARDVVSRTGHSLALGCLHRYVGGIGCGHHVKTSVSILLALAQDSTSPEVQTWALHSLALIVDSSGPMYRAYVEATLSLSLSLLLTVPPSHMEVHQCLGRCLASLITTLGPELQGVSGLISAARASCQDACAILQAHTGALVRAQAIACLQQLHMFAPRHVNLAGLVPELCAHLYSSHLLLRRAAVACLRQLAQREAAEVCEHAAAPSGMENSLEGVLFSMLDRETDRKLCLDIRDTIGHMLSSLAVDKLAHWLYLCKEVLTASTGVVSSNVPTQPDEGDKSEVTDDDTMFAVSGRRDERGSAIIAPRWATRVFAVECLCRVVALCAQGDPAHFDPVLAKERLDFLVLHLPELIRMAFMAATDQSEQLRAAGLHALQDIILRFATVPEPDFPGHLLLEQYQANVGAALRPAFSSDTPPDITAKACQVCSAWIGSGVVSDLGDLRRVHQLLVSALARVNAGRATPGRLYSDGSDTMQRLAVLAAWARVSNLQGCVCVCVCVCVCMRFFFCSLLSLVVPEVPRLSGLWLAALRDHALLTLPLEFASQLPSEGGAFYSPETMEAARVHYRSCWAPLLHAAALWLHTAGFDNTDTKSTNGSTGRVILDLSDLRGIFCLAGIGVEFLCSPRVQEPIDCVVECLQALYTLLNSPWPRVKLGADQLLGVELLSVLHRLLLTRDIPRVHFLILAVTRQAVRAAQEHVSEKRRSTEEDDGAAEKESVPEVGEGEETGILEPGSSLCLAAMELCLCVLVRQLPQLNPKLLGTSGKGPRPPQQLPSSGAQLVCQAVDILAVLSSLCSPAGAVSMLPTVLFLITGVLQGTAMRFADSSLLTPVPKTLQALRVLVSSTLGQNPKSCVQWSHFLRSSLATILDFPTPGHCGVLDEGCILTALAIFLRSAPLDVLAVTSLRDRCMDRFRAALDSNEPHVQLRCCQLLHSLFQHPERALAAAYIQSLAPRLVRRLQATEASTPDGQVQLQSVQEGLRLLELLVSLAEEQNRVQLLALLVPLLIRNLLDEDSLISTTMPCRALHHFALDTLMRIGPLHPAAFKTIMSTSQPLKARLEAAIRTRQNSTKNQNTTFSTAAQPRPIGPVKPTIELKTSFGNF